MSDAKCCCTSQVRCIDCSVHPEYLASPEAERCRAHRRLIQLAGGSPVQRHVQVGEAQVVAGPETEARLRELNEVQLARFERIMRGRE